MYIHIHGKRRYHHVGRMVPYVKTNSKRGSPEPNIAFSPQKMKQQVVPEPKHYIPTLPTLDLPRPSKSNKNGG
jgi:hypothetical protein